MSKVVKKANGFAGQLEITDKKAIIKRKGIIAFLLFGKRRDEEIPLSRIALIKFERAGITHGYIRFILEGEKELVLRRNELIFDEHTVLFDIWQQSKFIKIKEEIEWKVAHVRAKKEEEKIRGFRRLVEIREKGIISKKDFEKERKKILGL